MRSYNKNDLTGKIFKKECQCKSCEIKIFFTTNPTAKFCSDYCKGQNYLEIHELEIKHLKIFQVQFKANADALKHLYSLGINKPTGRDLKIAGYDFEICDIQRMTKDGRPAYVYFNYMLVISKDGNSFEIIKLKN